MSRTIYAQGPILFSQIPDLLKENGIDYKDYSNSKKLKPWLLSTYPEFTELNDGLFLGFSSDITTKPLGSMDEIAQILSAHIQDNGSILFSQIPDLLNNRSIDYTKYSNGQKLKPWLLSIFPQFTESENGLSLIFNQTDSVYPPNILQMHALAFMNYWTINAKKLGKYSSSLTAMPVNDLRDHVAARMALGLLGQKDVLLDASGDEDPRIAFDLSLATDNGDPIYCVLQKNPKNTDGSKQPWGLLGFCFPGEADEDGLGTWLAERFSLSTTSCATPDYASLSEQIDAVDALRTQLLSHTEDYLNALRAGQEPKVFLADTIAEYETKWSELLKYAHTLSPSSEPVSLEALAQSASTSNLAQQQLQQAIDLFDQLVQNTDKLFQSLHFPKDGQGTLLTDRNFLHEQYCTRSSIPNLSAFYDRLTPYCGLLEIIRAESLTPQLDSHIQAV